jgi:hypothetical protein
MGGGGGALTNETCLLVMVFIMLVAPFFRDYQSIQTNIASIVFVKESVKELKLNGIEKLR